MAGISDRHSAVLDELVGWWQNLSRRKISSRAILVPVPPRWGRTHLINKFATFVEDDDPVSIVVRVRGAALPDGLGLQALELRKLFTEARVEHRVAGLLGVDRLGGVTQLALNVAGLFMSPLATLVGLLLAGVGVGAAGKVWDESLAGQQGLVAKLARAVAAVSVSVPVVVIIDDADQLELDVAVILIENLIGRIDGQVLVVAAANPGGDLVSALNARAALGLTESRVHTSGAVPAMDYQARVDLAAELCPELPAAAIRRIGQRTQTFAEVFAVAAAGRLAEVDEDENEAATVKVVDEVIDAQVNRAPPSRLAVLLAWAGGVLHAWQAERAVKILGEERPDDDSDVLRFESLIRLADPSSPRLTEQVRILTASQRQRLAKIVLDTALDIGGDPGAGLVDKVVAWQAVHRVRADLPDHAQLLGVQGQLVHCLEDLDDPAAAYQVAATALEEYVVNGPGQRQALEYDDLLAALLRLARAQQVSQGDVLVDATIDAVTAGGAAVGLEARIWAAIDLLGQPGQRRRALKLTGQIAAELGQRNDLGAVGNRWRLQLAFHAGRAGYPAISQHLLAPLLNGSGSAEDEDAARAVLYAVGGPGADTRLQIVGLEAELAALLPDADDDRLRVHHALAADYGKLGDYDRALHHSQQELLLRRRIQGADHRDTLNTCGRITVWTARSGQPAQALRLARELLRDRERVLGHDHPDTLSSRHNIASLTAECGNLAKALRLFREALCDRERVLGHDHPDTLNTLNNIAAYTGRAGNPAKAAQLHREVLRRREQALGHDHPDTLESRNNIAQSIGEAGNPAKALQLFEELLPELKRVFGPDHPNTLSTRTNIAWFTGQSGHPAQALRLYQKLLPDQEWILGRDHLATLKTRSNIASFTGQSGHPAQALRLYQKLLPDQERILGRDHPDTLITRRSIQTLSTRGDSPSG